MAKAKDSTPAEAALPALPAHVVDYWRDQAVKEIEHTHCALILLLHDFEEELEDDYFLQVGALKVIQRSLAEGLQHYLDASKGAH